MFKNVKSRKESLLDSNMVYEPTLGMSYNPEEDYGSSVLMPKKEEKGWLDFADLRNILPIDYQAMKDESVKNISAIQETYNPGYEGMFSDPESNYESLWDMLNFELLGQSGFGALKGLYNLGKKTKSALGFDTHTLHRGVTDKVKNIDELTASGHVKEDKIIGQFQTVLQGRSAPSGKKVYDSVVGEGPGGRYAGYPTVDVGRNIDDLLFTATNPRYASNRYGFDASGNPGSLMSFEVPEWYIKKYGLHKMGDSPKSLMEMLESGIISFPEGLPKNYLKDIGLIQGPAFK